MSLQVVGRVSQVIQPLRPHILPEKPLSLRVHEKALFVLRALVVVLELAVGSALCFLVEGAIFSEPLALAAVVLAVCTPLFALAWWGEHKLESRLKEMKNPEWINYYAAAYRDLPLEALMEALPDRNVWKRLPWDGLFWKEKILPYAEKHHLDRRDLKEEFGSVFGLFTPYLHDYYRSLELPLLREQGYHAYLARAGTESPRTIRFKEMREQLLRETEGLAADQIRNRYPTRTIQKYLGEFYDVDRIPAAS